MMKAASGDDPGLLAQLRAGEAKAFEELVIAYQHRVFGVVLRMLGNRAIPKEGAAKLSYRVRIRY
jgi:DNA-directed RNA polymerase specialized sigma24 family protein